MDPNAFRADNTSVPRSPLETSRTWDPSQLLMLMCFFFFLFFRKAYILKHSSQNYMQVVIEPLGHPQHSNQNTGNNTPCKVLNALQSTVTWATLLVKDAMHEHAFCCHLKPLGNRAPLLLSSGVCVQHNYLRKGYVPASTSVTLVAPSDPDFRSLTCVHQPPSVLQDALLLAFFCSGIV